MIKANHRKRETDRQTDRQTKKQRETDRQRQRPLRELNYANNCPNVLGLDKDYFPPLRRGKSLVLVCYSMARRPQWAVKSWATLNINHITLFNRLCMGNSAALASI